MGFIVTAESEGMTYRGVVRGGMIRTRGSTRLPEGAEVEIVVRVESKKQVRSTRPKRGTAAALRDFLRGPPSCDPADVAALVRAIDAGRRKLAVRSPFRPTRSRR